jgi:hypothetical protein
MAGFRRNVLENEQRADEIKLALAQPGQFVALDEGHVPQSRLLRILPRVNDHRRRNVTGDDSRRSPGQRQGEPAYAASEIKRRREGNVMTEEGANRGEQ